MSTTKFLLETYGDELQRFLESLTSGDVVPLSSDDDPPWFQPGVNCEIAPEVYSYQFTANRPRYLPCGLFATGTCGGLLRLFWDDGRKCYGRELRDDEAVRFCELTGVELQP